MHRGEVLYERHAAGSSSDQAHPLASGTKSFSGVMLAAAIEDGLVTGFDERVSDTITEWRGDARLERITLRELLSLTGGLDGGLRARPPSYAESIKAKSMAAPGERFRYGPISFQVFGEVLRRKLQPRGEGVAEYLQRRILDPIGIRVGAWRTDSDGNPNLPSGASLTARDWAKFGEMLRNGGAIAARNQAGEGQGEVEGRGERIQLIRPELLAELFQGSRANRTYGVTVWLLDGGRGADPEGALRDDARGRLRGRLRAALGLAEQSPEAPRGVAPASTDEAEAQKASDAPHSTGQAGEGGIRDRASTDAADAALDGAFMAAGLGKQRLYVLPALELVVVRQGELDRSTQFSDREFLALLLGLQKHRQPAEGIR